MSGIHASSTTISAAASFSYGLTPGNNLGTPGLFGWSFAGSDPGTLGPITSLKGKSFEFLRSDSSSRDLIVQLASPDVAQSFWRMVMVQDTSGVWRRYLSANATSFTGRFWGFGTGSSPVWTSTAGPRGVIFFP